VGGGGGGSNTVSSAWTAYTLRPCTNGEKLTVTWPRSRIYTGQWLWLWVVAYYLPETNNGTCHALTRTCGVYYAPCNNRWMCTLAFKYNSTPRSGQSAHCLIMINLQCLHYHLCTVFEMKIKCELAGVKVKVTAVKIKFVVSDHCWRNNNTVVIYDPRTKKKDSVSIVRRRSIHWRTQARLESRSK
jgi:hypothetical protein